MLNKLKNSPGCPSSSIGDAIYTEKQRPRIYHGDASFVYPHPSNSSHQPFVGTYPRIPLLLPRSMSLGYYPSPSSSLLITPLAFPHTNPFIPQRKRHSRLGLHGLELAIGTAKQEEQEANDQQKPSAKSHGARGRRRGCVKRRLRRHMGAVLPFMFVAINISIIIIIHRTSTPPTPPARSSPASRGDIRKP